MLQLLITAGQTTTDYTQFVDQGSIQIQEQINVPAQMQFTLCGFGGAFDIPPQNAYVRLVSTNINKEPGSLQQSLYSGFITAPPTVSFLGMSPYAPRNMGQLFAYQFQSYSDEFLLNMKSVPFIPAYTNRTMGQILIDLAATLAPGLFDFTNVMDGDVVPYFTYTPSQNWSQIAKQFADSIRFRYKVRDHKIWFVPYGDWAFGIHYDEAMPQSTFKADTLQTKPLVVPLVNDVTIIGDAEAGNLHYDYFLGDGFTGNFPLKHKVYLGSSTLLLQEPWTNQSIDEQQWFLQDPQNNFDFSAGALNVLTAPGNAFTTFGESYLALNNGIEIAGGIDIEHGEVVFNDTSQGVIGGLYEDSNFDIEGWICGFYVSSPLGVSVTASGAVGVEIQPFFRGVGQGQPIITQINQTYVLQTIVTAPAYARYNRIYRSFGGSEFGGAEQEVQGNITFVVQQFDIAAATGFWYAPTVYQVSVGPVPLPAFATYALINNEDLNCSLTNTTLGLMPLGSLEGYLGQQGLFSPTGLVLPALNPYISSVGYRGPVAPWPAQASGTIYPLPMHINPAPQQLVLGNGFENQAAQITSGNEADTLSFYAQTLPAAGTPVHLRSWEQQAAVARLQALESIQEQQFIVGDDGLRAAIVSDLNPLPRTSEDCDNAALAYLQDHTNSFYNGSYACESFLFNGYTRESQYWPCVGRYFFVNSPFRQINKRNFLVTSLTTTVLSLADELLGFQFQFGSDLNLEKVLKNFVDLRPNIPLTPKDTAKPPNPRLTQNVTNTYLPDLTDLRVDQLNINSDLCPLVLDPPYDRIVEIRRQDTNWGRGATWDLVGQFTGPSIHLIRSQYEQTWYARQVQVRGISTLTSRRTTVIRVVYPRVPSAPEVVSVDSHYIQLNYSGDHRNIALLEVQNQAGVPILQRPVNSYADLLIDITQTVNTIDFTPFRIFYCQFINLSWEYGPVAQFQWQGVLANPSIVVPTPVTPTITFGSRSGTTLILYADVSTRADITSEEWRVYSSPDLASPNLVSLIRNISQSGSQTFTVPATGTLYVVLRRFDFLGPGNFSTTLVVS